MCNRSSGSQPYHGLHEKKAWPAAPGKPFEAIQTSPGALCPAVKSSVQERNVPVRAGPE